MEIPQTSQQADQEALTLTRAIGLAESGTNGKPNYNATGKSGEHGAYQWMPNNFENAAKQYGLDPTDFSPVNQDKVAYAQVKAYKDKGYQPREIASLWNSGSPENWQNHSEVNSQGVSYDTPAYVQRVKQNYQKLKGASSGSQPQDQSLGQQLGGRLNDISSNVSDLSSFVTGQGSKQNPLSDVLQGVGSVAGGINDTVQKGLEYIPGVKQAEDFLGKGVGALANTGVGKSITSGIQGFQKSHPELSSDIGALGNIAGTVGLVTGAGEIKGLVGRTLEKGLGGVLGGVGEKSAIKELADVASRTVGGRTNIGESELKVLAQKEFTPTIEGGKYVTKDSYDNLGHAISNIEDNELQPAIQKVSTQNVADRQPIESIRQQTLKNAEQEFKSSGNVAQAKSSINKIFDDYKSSYGDYVTLQDVNDMKRGIRTSVNFNSPKLDQNISYQIGQVFQKNIEDSATRLGLGDVNAINQKMASLIKAQNSLQYIEGKVAKSGTVGKILREGVATGASAIGEGLGNMTGVPYAGAIGARSMGNIASKVLNRKTVGGLVGRLRK